MAQNNSIKTKGVQHKFDNVNSDSKLQDQSLLSRITEVEAEKTKLEDEIKTLIGVNYSNQRDKVVQTDLTNGVTDDPSADPQQLIKKLKEDLLEHRRNASEQKARIDYLSDRILELEQDIQIRDKALLKLTQGTQMAEAIGSVKLKIKEDLNHKFMNLKTHIQSLEGVIDTNSKLIKDLTDAVQERNIENQALKNEDKIKLGKIETLINKTATLERLVQDKQIKETQLRVIIEKMIRERDQHFKEVQISLPLLQLSTEQVIISELQEQVIHLKVENLKLEEMSRKFENQAKQFEVNKNDQMVELERYKSKVDNPDQSYILKAIKANPQNLDQTVSKINEALQYIDRNITRHNFKEQLLNLYEDKIAKQQDKYEQLLVKHFQQQTHLQICQSQLSQLRLMQPIVNATNNSQNQRDPTLTDMIQQQWQQTDKHLQRFENFSKDQFKENQRLKVKLQEIEEQLIKYKKYVMFDPSHYDHLFKLKHELPLTQTELGIINMFLTNQQVSEFQRLSRILDIIIKNNIEMEYKLTQNNSEKLRNEYHLIIEQREMEVRQRMTIGKVIEDDLDGKEAKMRKLEYMVEQIELDTKLIETMNKEGNQTSIMVNESFAFLDQIQSLIDQSLEDNMGLLVDSKKIIVSNIHAQGNKTQEQIQNHSQNKVNATGNEKASSLNKTQDQIVKKKVQTTNLIPMDGKKPRLANDYNKQAKKSNAPPQPSAILQILQKIDQNAKDCHLKLSSIQSQLQEEQHIRARQASDSLKEIQILKEALLNRQSENQDLINDMKHILLTKNELVNQLSIRDYMIQIGGIGDGQTQSLNNSPRGKGQNVSQGLAGKGQVGKLEGLVKVNNFIRKKELEAREECDLVKHKIEKLDKERLSLTLDNKKLTEQIKYLQQLLKNQREAFRRGGNLTDQLKDSNNGIENADIPEDDIVKFLIQIDELNQKNSELEYMLQYALQSNIEKEKLMRGTEELVEDINTKIEQISFLVTTQIPISKQLPQNLDNKSTKLQQVKKPKLPKMADQIGPETVFERLNVLNIYIHNWYQQVQDQVREIQKQKELIENMKPNNQTLTQAEHQAKLEKYLSIYSARIQTLSSIIASYQRHFKTLEDQIRDLQNIPNLQAINQVPTQRQLESARIESLKRMINLKDILIKHQQNEIELIKKTVIADKTNENQIYYVSQEEKDALIKMRQFDMQVKVIQDYERQILLTEQPKKGEEHIYLKQVNLKIQQDLLNVKEVFQTNWNENKVNGSKNNSEKKSNDLQTQQQISLEQRDYLQKWLNTVKDLIQNQFDNQKCKFYVEVLNQEIPIILSIMTSLKEKNQVFKNDQQDPSLEVTYLEQKIVELNEQNSLLEGKIDKHKDRCNFLRSKNQHIQEQNLLLKKFLHTKKALADDFKHFYKQDLLQENELLRSSILNLTPYNEKLTLETATLKEQVQVLNYKLIKQDERHIREQELFQNLEQTLLDTQKKLIEKDSEVVRMIKAQRETLFKGNQDQALDLLINTADTLNQETVKLREQNCQLSSNLKSKRLQLEQKIAKIKDSKNILRCYEEKIKELTIDNEKLKALKIPQQIGEGTFTSVLGIENPQTINKDKLIYELGKDGANTVIKFLDEIAHYKEQISRLANEIQEVKVKNTTLMLLVQDKANKLQVSENQLRQIKKENINKGEKIEKLEFMYQKVNDDYIAQQQALDVYVEIAIPNIGRDQLKAFSKCVDNAKILATMLSDLQKQRNHYYESSIYYERQAHLLSEQLKIQRHEYNQINQKIKLLQDQSLHNGLQVKISQGILARYEKEISIINKIVQESNVGIESLIYTNPTQQQMLEQSPLKNIKDISVIDSPPIQATKKGILKSEQKSAQGQILNSNQQAQRVYNFSDRSSIHILLNSQLEINTLKAHHAQLLSKIKQLQTQNNHNTTLINYHKYSNSSMLRENHFLSNLNFQWRIEIDNIKLQNIYLSRLCLYSYRANTLLQKRNDMSDQAQVETLISQEIDKLKIENRLLQERNETLETKLDKFMFQEQQEEVNDKQILKERQRIEMLERELQQQIEWNTQLEQEIMSKAAQIEALSKIHNNFSHESPLALTTSSTTAAKPQNLPQVQSHMPHPQNTQDEDIVIKNLRMEYAKLESKNQKLHERIYLLENKNNQKDQKIQRLSAQVRELEKYIITFDENNSDNWSLNKKERVKTASNQAIGVDKQEEEESQQNSGKLQQINKSIKASQNKVHEMISSREIQLQQDIDEIWKKMAELNSLKNSLYDRNEDLRVEIESFKTHFSKYEAQEFKKRVQGQDSFQYQLYQELTLLREERDMLIWQLNKQTARIFDQQGQIDIYRGQMIPSLEEAIRRQEDNEIKYEKEIQILKEQFLQHTVYQAMGHKDFDNIRTMLQLFEGGRLKRDRVHLVYENARLRRENDSLHKEVDNSKKLQQRVLTREFELKKKLVDLKNEIVKLRVTYDMGEYQNLVIGKTPSKTNINKKTGLNDDLQQPSHEKIKQYVEDLAVLRENLLKIEFRNIELEELHSKKEREIEELQQHVKDLKNQLEASESKGLLQETEFQESIELKDNTRQVVDLQQRLMEEQWENEKIKKRLVDYEYQNKELLLIQDKHLEEIKDHQKLNTKLTIMAKQISDLQRPRLQQDPTQDQSDIVFFDMLKDRFLMYLSLYIDELRLKNKQLLQAQEKTKVVQDQLIRSTIKIEAFSKERESYKLLIDSIINQKINQVEQDFVTTAQHEEGLSKLEVHIMNQRKKLVQLKSQLDVARNERDVLEQNSKAMNEIIKNLEKHSMEYNYELTEAKDECVKLRGDRERYEQRVGFMWDRLDFQERLHHKVVINNASQEQVIKVYKEEIGKLKAFLHLNINNANDGNKGKHNDQQKQHTDTTKSHVIQIENELARFKSKYKNLEEHIERLINENEELKLHINLVDLLRKAVGISAQERDSLTSQLSKKRSKLKDLQVLLIKESKEKDKQRERVDFLEKQIMQIRNNGNAGGGLSIGNYVKASLQDEDEEGLYDQQELQKQIRSLKHQIKDLEAQNFGLKQKLTESQGLNAQNESKKQQQARAITPVRIREMQIKNFNTSSGNISQRLNSLKQQQPQVQEYNNEFYYGQNNNLDPLSQLKEDINEAMMERQNSGINSTGGGTKLPKIGNQNYITLQQQDIQPTQGSLTQTSSFGDKQQRNLTPLQARMKATHSTIANGMGMGYLHEDQYQQEKPPMPLLQNKTPLLGKINRQAGSNGGRSVQRNNMGNRTIIEGVNDAPGYEAYLNNMQSNLSTGPQLNPQGFTSLSNQTSQNNFIFKNL